jgi:hypothetical protein
LPWLAGWLAGWLADKRTLCIVLTCASAVLRLSLWLSSLRLAW